MNTNNTVGKDLVADLYIGGKRAVIVDQDFWLENLEKYSHDPSVVHTLKVIVDNWVKDKALLKMDSLPSSSIRCKVYDHRTETFDPNFNPQFDLWKLHPTMNIVSIPESPRSMIRFRLIDGDKYVVYLAYQILKVAYPDALLQIMSKKSANNDWPQYIVAATLKDEVIILDFMSDADRTYHELLNGFVRNDELMKGRFHYIS